ncbi:hypothetical protein [Rhizobium mayense]|uniref:Uncharacterized protein n=1 Tax=Rhizobium mayense TaxID=1312184 RepID=A0ABT7K3D5_9HYPH|nr:hypothetical protein [Rhizobium mayense]MDL2403108.1 hypothetical protein [Rhizobium mayense]
MSTPWTTSIKQLGPVRNPEPPANPHAGSFAPPGFGTVTMAPLDLFKSIARCTALTRSSPALVAALLTSSRALLEFLVDDATNVIAFIDDVTNLADSERTALSGRMGAGITDQTMEMLGFVWRDVTEELIASAGPLADYVYEDSTGTLVLAEAKGSITTGATQSGTDIRARNAYRRQVDPYAYTYPLGAKGGPSVGLIEHGYAMAFAALPGPATAPAPLGQRHFPPCLLPRLCTLRRVFCSGLATIALCSCFRMHLSSWKRSTMSCAGLRPTFLRRCFGRSGVTRGFS